MSFAEETIRRTHPLGSRSFDKLRVQGVIDVKLTQSNGQKVEIEATDDGHQHITVDVTDDQVLSISTARYFRASKKAVAYVDVTTLKSCVLDNVVGTVESTNEIEQKDNFSLQVNNGVANVDLNLNTLVLDAFISGTSKCKLMGKVSNETNIRSKGVFTIDTLSLITPTMNIFTNGVGKAFVSAINQVNIDADGTSQIFYRGPLGRVRQHGVAKIAPHI